MLEPILKAMEAPEKLVNPTEIVNLISQIRTVVDVLKEEIFEGKLKVSQKFAEIRKRPDITSVEVARAELDGTEENRELHEKIRLKERLNGFRKDLEYKLFLITGQKY